MKPPKGVHYDEKEDTYTYQSHSNAEKTYLVIPWDRKADKWQCTCPHFLYRGKECKHITRVKFIDELHASIDRLLPQNKGLLPKE
jgi:hypothetical protein